VTASAEGDIVNIRYQETVVEDIEDLASAVVRSKVLQLLREL
jgi:hypothetical protein